MCRFLVWLHPAVRSPSGSRSLSEAQRKTDAGWLRSVIDVRGERMPGCWNPSSGRPSPDACWKGGIAIRCAPSATRPSTSGVSPPNHEAGRRPAISGRNHGAVHNKLLGPEPIIEVAAHHCQQAAEKLQLRMVSPAFLRGSQFDSSLAFSGRSCYRSPSGKSAVWETPTKFAS